MKFASNAFSLALTISAVVVVDATQLGSPIIGDECRNAIDITSVPSMDVINTFDYTYNPKDPKLTCPYHNDTSKSIWWKYTANEVGLITIDMSGLATFNATSSELDNVVGVFTGSCSNLKFVSCNDRERSPFAVAPGITYYIKVSEFNNIEFSPATGNATLNFTTSLTDYGYFNLINATTDKPVGLLRGIYPFGPVGNTLDYQTISSSSFSIEAVFNNSIKSVQLTFDNPRRNVCENNRPFTLFGDSGGDIIGAPIQIGDRVVTATGFSQSKCKGRQNGQVSHNFSVVGCVDMVYHLYDASNRKFISNLHNASDIEHPPCSVNVEALFGCGFLPSNVRIELRRASDNMLVKGMDERVAPYFLFGDNGKGKLSSGNIPAGEYVLRTIIDGIIHPQVQFTIGTCNPNPPVVDSTFDVDLNFNLDPLSEYENAKLFAPGLKRLSTLIVGDRPDVVNATALVPDRTYQRYPPVIDDFNLHIAIAISDGPGGNLGFFSADQIRESDGLPFVTLAIIDPADLLYAASLGEEESYVVQIMLNVLGLGLTSVWESKTLAQGVSPCRYRGLKAVEEFNAITGCSATTIPLFYNQSETSDDDCRYWDESCLKNEILSFPRRGQRKVSRITLGALEDLGYVVNYTAADPYGADDIGVCAGCNGDVGGGSDRRMMEVVDVSASAPIRSSSSCDDHSAASYKNAIRFGQQSRRTMYAKEHNGGKQLQRQLVNGANPLATKGGIVMYMHEDGTLCNVMVPSSNDDF